MEVLNIEAMGYRHWLRSDSPIRSDKVELSDGRTANIHPFIQAESYHAERLEGVKVGEWIAGVRWFS